MKQYTKSGAESFATSVMNLFRALRLAGFSVEQSWEFINSFYQGAANDPVDDLTVRTIKVR